MKTLLLISLFICNLSFSSENCLNKQRNSELDQLIALADRMPQDHGFLADPVEYDWYHTAVFSVWYNTNEEIIPKLTFRQNNPKARISLNINHSSYQLNGISEITVDFSEMLYVMITNGGIATQLEIVSNEEKAENKVYHLPLPSGEERITTADFYLGKMDCKNTDCAHLITKEKK